MWEVVEKYIKDLMIREGGSKYTNHPKDSGGPTRYGVTERVARASGYRGSMRELPESTAFRILMFNYWYNPRFDEINNRHAKLAERMLDFGVLAGQSTSVKMLQRCLNILNRNEKDYFDISVDGYIGMFTINALDSFMSKRKEQGGIVLLGMVTSLQSVYLIELGERRPKDEEWMYGWQLNRAIGAILIGE